MFRYVFQVRHYVLKWLWIFLNRLKLKISGAIIGDKCRVYNGFYLLIKYGGKMFVGDNVLILSGNYYNPLVQGIKTAIYVREGGVLRIGNNSGISSSCIHCIKSITIGNHVQIGANTLIMDNDAHSIDFKLRRNAQNDTGEGKPVVIEDDVLIGTGCKILKGVTIGARSIIGAGSIVTKNIPADCVAAGNPCKVIRNVVYE